MLPTLVMLMAAQWLAAAPAPEPGWKDQYCFMTARWYGLLPVARAPARVWPVRLWRGAVATCAVARVAIHRLPLADAKAALGVHTPATNGLCHTLQHPDSPLVLVYDNDRKRNPFRRAAPLSYYWREWGHASVAGRLQGAWRVHGVMACGRESKTPGLHWVPQVYAHVQGDAIEFMTVYAPVTMVYEARRAGGSTRLVANFPDPAERALFDGLPNPDPAERTLVWVGPVLLTATTGPGWLELSAWVRE